MAAPTIISATIPVGGDTIEIVFSEAATWAGNDHVHVTFGSGEGIPLPADRLHQTDEAPTSGDGTDTHVYSLIGRAFGGETVTVTIPADTVEDGGSVGNVLISGATVTNNSEATQGNCLSRVKPHLIAAWAIRDRCPIDREEASSPTFKVALKAMDEFCGISQVEFTFSTAVTKTGGSSSATHATTSMVWEALTGRTFEEWYWLVEIDVDWAKGSTITVDAEVTFEDGTTQDLSGTLGERGLYRAKAREDRNILFLKGDSGTDTNLVAGDIESGGDDSKALETMTKCMERIYVLHSTVKVDEVLVQEGVNDGALFYSTDGTGGYKGIDTFGKHPQDSSGDDVMLFIGADDAVDKVPDGDLIFRNDETVINTENFGSYIYMPGWKFELQQDGSDLPSGWDINGHHVSIENFEINYASSGSGMGTINAFGGNSNRGQHFSLIDGTISKGDRGVNLGDSVNGIPIHPIVSNVVCTGGGSAMRYGTLYACVEGFIAHDMINPNAVPGWPAGEHHEFIASNRTTAVGATGTLGQAIFSGCFNYRCGGDNGSKDHTYNFMQIAGPSGSGFVGFEGMGVVNCGAHPYADTQQIIRLQHVSNAQIVHNAFVTDTPSLSSGVGIVFQDQFGEGTTQEFVLCRNNVSSNYNWSSSVDHDDMRGRILDGLATDDDYALQNFNPADGRWNNVTATNGNVETVYDIDNIASGDFQPVVGSSLDGLGSPTGIVFDAEGTTRGSSPDIGPVQVASGGGGGGGSGVATIVDGAGIQVGVKAGL